MQAFTELRRQAQLRRDKAIARARSEYAETLTKIAGLEQDLLGRDPTSHRSIASCIESTIPADRPFTTVDIMAALEALDPGRVWRKRSIDNHLSRLRERGLVVRLRKSKNTEPALYARVGAQVETDPFGDMTLPEVMAQVLQQRGAMNATELALALLDAGYVTTMDRKGLRNAVGVALRKDARFVGRGGKWGS